MLLSIIVPLYNEEGNVKHFYNSIKATLQDAGYNYELIFVNDGSSDKTLVLLKELALADSNVFYLSFSRNFGHQNALKAGLDFAKGDAVITMDGDLQHPPQVVLELINEWKAGYEVVYTVRQDADSTGAVKKSSSNLFYRILNSISGIELEKGTADFRLIDRKVLNILKQMNELDLFWRGLVKWVGFNQKAINYKAEERFSGQSKYTFKKMKSLAAKGITSFSTKPLSFAVYLGFFFAACSLLYIPYILFSLFYGQPVSGWASVIVTIVFFGGINLIILGVIGIYIGQLFMQAKGRPHYILQETNIHGNS
jgi:polyisoprenyl-phosphate glycosyltransferase